MTDESERPRSVNEGAGSDGGGVDGREGTGDDARDESFMGGVDDVVGSRNVGGNWSRRCMRFEKKPDIRFDARVCCSQHGIMAFREGHSRPTSPDDDSFDPAKRRR